MSEHAQLLLPDIPLAGCLFAAILRDTRGVTLSPAQRFNHFPASPLVSLSLICQGSTRLVDRAEPTAVPENAVPLAPVTVAGPQSRPISSWNPGPVLAISIGFYPDAWARLTGQPAQSLTDQVTTSVPSPLAELLTQMPPANDLVAFWQAFQRALLPLWLASGPELAVSGHTSRTRLSNWSRALAIRAALSGPGRSLRAAERRLRRWSGQNRRSLAFYASIEDLHARVTQDPTAPLADMAYAAGFADQSHMGRAVKRATGFSPAQLNRLIDKDEAFWCYRILGERF